MLYIENIDNNSIRFGNAVGGGTYPSVYPKTLLAKTDTQNPERVWITDKETKANLLNGRDVSTMNLDGTVYLTAHGFVVAFNNLINNTVAATTTTTAATTTAATTTTTVPVTTTTTTGA